MSVHILLWLDEKVKHILSYGQHTAGGAFVFNISVFGVDHYVGLGVICQVKYFSLIRH